MYGTVLASIHFWRIIYDTFHLFSFDFILTSGVGGAVVQEPLSPGLATG